MMPALQPKLLLLAIGLFLGGRVFTQDNADLYPPERTLLELIANDTISHTVSYLPEAFQFSVKDKGDKHFILLKSGRHNYFLLDGTNRVYIPDPALPTSRLLRIDSTSFVGDNFNMMAFIRKDTLYQYGGYGFWDNRDFFSIYKPTIHGWEFVSGGDGLENLFTLNYFDRKSDQFFTIGRYHQNTHQRMTPAFYDSVYRYDMQTKKWKILGQIRNADFKTNNTQRAFLWTAPFGPGVYYFKKCLFIDFLNNKVYPLRKSTSDSLEFMLEDIPFPDKKFHHLIYLRDTLFAINGNERSVSIGKIRLVRSDFNTPYSEQLYTPVSSLSGKVFLVSITLLQSILLIVSVIIISILLFIYRSRKNRKELKHSNINEGNGIPGIIDQIQNLRPGLITADKHKNQDITSFMQSLGEVEKELVKDLAIYNLQGKKMDTHEINKILGVSQKETEIQKTRRSMTITRINNLYTQTMKTNGLLIQRERDPFDKRAYLYSMPADLAKLISAATF